MLSSISLKFTERSTPMVVRGGGVTVFVGPNNSGKSLVLRELEMALGSNSTINTKILDSYELQWPSKEAFEQELAKILKHPRARRVTSPDHVAVGQFQPNGSWTGQEISLPTLKSQVEQRRTHWVGSQYYRYFLARLDGRTRFELVNDRPAGDLADLPINVLAHLFQDDELRSGVRAVVHDAIGLYFVIDPLNGGQLRIRLSSSMPTHLRGTCCRYPGH